MADAGLDKHLIAFFDTGSPKNIMPLSTYNLLFSHIELKQVSRGLITDVSGNQLQVKGEIDLTLKFGRVPMKLKAWVVDLNLFAHILIGYPTMANYVVEIKPHKDVMLV